MGNNTSCNSQLNPACLFCSNLKKTEWEIFHDTRNMVMSRKGQYIYNEHSRPQGVYCVSQGKVKITKSGSDGKEQIISLAKSGDVLGLAAYFLNEEYSSAAAALEDSYICYIPREVFDHLLCSNILLDNSIRKLLCQVNQDMENKILSLSQKTVRERLAGNILLLNKHFGISEKNNEMMIDLPLTREDMANLVGTATETVIRLLSEFKKEGILYFNGKRITITDINSLKKVAEFYS
jgi:CRP-like cAMP-binding protein